MQTKSKVFLASGSPRRLELLQNLGCCVAQISVPFDEPKVSNFKDPYAFMEVCIDHKFEQANAYFYSQKEIHNLSHKEGQILLVADTVAAKGSQILGKPAEKIEAFEMLKKLNGQTHEVFTSYKLWITCAQVCEPKIFRTKTVVSKVKFKKVTQEFLKIYIRSGEPLDKAGSYGVQGQGLQLIESIDGSYSSVMGLPTYELLCDLCELEVSQNLRIFS